MDPHWFSALDPDPHSGTKLDPDPHWNQCGTTTLLAVFANNFIQSTPIGFPLQAVTNEALTKKKFCQSVRIFQQIFSSDNQFHAFLRSVAHMKKCVFEVMFQMFLEVLPPTTVARLPGELWEKIWKHTQNEYLYAKTVPLMSDTYYKAGLRAGSTPTPLRTLEQVGRILESQLGRALINPFFQIYVPVSE